MRIFFGKHIPYTEMSLEIRSRWNSNNSNSNNHFDSQV